MNESKITIKVLNGQLYICDNAAEEEIAVASETIVTTIHEAELKRTLSN